VNAVPFGEGALLLDLEIEGAPDRAGRTHRAAAVLQDRFPGADVALGVGTLLVHLPPNRAPEVLAALDLADVAAGAHALSGREHRLGAVYDGEDLEAVARASGLSPRQVIERHAGRCYVAELVGFLPGFAYLSELDPALVLPRRASPRPIVPSGSIGVAGRFTGVYPRASPGGWHLLGRVVDVDLFRADRQPPNLIEAGDRVRFEALSIDARPAPKPPAAATARATTPRARSVAIVAAPACATVQDAGRPGHLHRGIPASGPLDLEAFTAANLAVGNDAGAAAIEIPLGALEVRATADVIASIDGRAAASLAAGDVLRVDGRGAAVHYLAFAGGVMVPEVLGARATLVGARLGGHEGRPLRRGDVLAIGDPTGPPGRAAQPALELARPIAVTAGPHVARFPPGALAFLTSTEWRISRLLDRVGVRLEGPSVPRAGADQAAPVPMVRGAIQVSTDGTPIVFGPDHPTTGGYPVLAVVQAGSMPALARRPPGAVVHFALS
jgi:KipI family sensor histidine kinase inhibitor